MTNVADTVSKRVRYFITVLIGLIVVFAVIDVEVWPMTGWRLFSTIRDETQTHWVIEAVDESGERRIVSFEELPLAYRNGAWIVDGLPGTSESHSEAVCQAFLDAVLDVEPTTTELNMARNHARLEERDGEWARADDLEILHTCSPSEGS